MPLEKATFYSRMDIKANPDKLYIFGDNFALKGFGGQAKEARGEPNAIGVPTKRSPNWSEGAYLTDADFEEWRDIALPNMNLVKHALAEGKTVVMPMSGIGTGLAELETRAPKIFNALLEWAAELERFANSR